MRLTLIALMIAVPSLSAGAEAGPAGYWTLDQAREILDSRGKPTVEAEVTLDDGSFGMARETSERLNAAIAAGASAGAASQSPSSAIATRAVVRRRGVTRSC